jgi:hypothetical protein
MRDDRRLDLGIYMALFVVLTLMSQLWTPGSSQLLRITPAPVTAGSSLIPVLLLIGAWRGSDGAAGVLAGGHWAFGLLFIVSAFLGRDAIAVPHVHAVEMATASRFVLVYGIVNVVAGVCALRLIPRQSRAGVQTHAVGTVPTP